MSDPGMSGSGCGRALLPSRIQASHGPTPAASTRTSTWPRPGSGFGMSASFSTLGAPNSETTTAFMVPSRSDPVVNMLLKHADEPGRYQYQPDQVREAQPQIWIHHSCPAVRSSRTESRPPLVCLRCREMADPGYQLV